jgi:hypothetical protein
MYSSPAISGTALLDCGTAAGGTQVWSAPSANLRPRSNSQHARVPLVMTSSGWQQQTHDSCSQPTPAGHLMPAWQPLQHNQGHGHCFCYFVHDTMPCSRAAAPHAAVAVSAGCRCSGTARAPLLLRWRAAWDPTRCSCWACCCGTVTAPDALMLLLHTSLSCAAVSAASAGQLAVTGRRWTTCQPWGSGPAACSMVLPLHVAVPVDRGTAPLSRAGCSRWCSRCCAAAQAVLVCWAAQHGAQGASVGDTGGCVWPNPGCACCFHHLM